MSLFRHKNSLQRAGLESTVVTLLLVHHWIYLKLDHSKRITSDFYKLQNNNLTMKSKRNINTLQSLRLKRTTTTKSKVNESERKSKMKTATTALRYFTDTECVWTKQYQRRLYYCSNLYALTASVRLFFSFIFCCVVFTASVYRLQCPFLNLVVFRGVFFLFASSLSAGASRLFVSFGLDDKQFNVCG